MSKPDNVADWQRISPISVVFFLFHTVKEVGMNSLPAVFVVLAAFASGGPERKALLASLFGVVLLAGVALAVISWLRFRFRIEPDRILVRSGVIHREELDIDFGRIQNVSIREPFYMRPFRLAVLGIDTAGSSKKEIQLGGIDKRFALELKKTFLASGQSQPEGEASEEGGEASESVLLTRGTRDLVIYGLTMNFLLWVAIVIGFLAGAGDNAETLVIALAERVNVDRFIESTMSAGPLAAGFLAAGIVLAGLALFSLLSVAGALFRYHGYRLVRRGETYSRSSGMLTRHEESIKQHKIQAVVLRQNLIARIFDRFNMQLRVASAGKAGEGGSSLVGSRAAFALPALHPSEAGAFCAEFLPRCELKAAEFTRPNRKRLTRVVLFWTALIAVLPTFSTGLVVDKRFLALLPLALLLAWILSGMFWRRSGFSVAGDYGFIRRGALGTVTTVFPLFKTQRIDIYQTPGLRRLGLATFHVHLASHSLTVYCVDEAEARRFRDLALYHAESSKKAWF